MTTHTFDLDTIFWSVETLEMYKSEWCEWKDGRLFSLLIISTNLFVDMADQIFLADDDDF